MLRGTPSGACGKSLLIGRRINHMRIVYGRRRRLSRSANFLFRERRAEEATDASCIFAKLVRCCIGERPIRKRYHSNAKSEGSDKAELAQ